MGKLRRQFGTVNAPLQADRRPRSGPETADFRRHDWSRVPRPGRGAPGVGLDPLLDREALYARRLFSSARCAGVSLTCPALAPAGGGAVRSMVSVASARPIEPIFPGVGEAPGLGLLSLTVALRLGFAGQADAPLLGLARLSLAPLRGRACLPFAPLLSLSRLAFALPLRLPRVPVRRWRARYSAAIWRRARDWR